ncbi:MAG: HAMP domain-containing protein [Spirochaetes bacterium]|nr:HAMP domain-containing protein [Spirochaetota bacterium]
MKKLSFFLKIFSGYFFIILVLSLVILFFNYTVTRNHIVQILTNSLRNIDNALKIKIQPLIANDQISAIDPLVKQIGNRISTRITIVRSDGLVIADSERNPRKMENHLYRKEIQEALEGKMGTSLRHSRTIKEHMLYVAIPIKVKDKVWGVLRTSIFLRDIKILLSDLRTQIWPIALIIIFLSLLGAVFISRNISSPLQDLVVASRKVAEGDFNIKIFRKTNDQIKELADSFNYMTSKIKDLFNEISYEKEEMGSIISSIKEGLVVLDKKGQILMANQAFRRITANDDIDDKYYWEVIREESFSILFKKMAKKKDHFTEELQLGEKNYILSVTPLSLKNEFVLVFYDITESKKLEKIKKDFVTNVSHELRTPLTAIKGFIETLLEKESDEDKKHYLEVIEKHTDRLINIVKDLLSLSRLEEQAEKLEMEKVKINHILDNVVKLVEQKIKSKGLKLIKKIPRNLPPVQGDPFKLEQAFINLIDNAIRYTDKGQITLSASQEDKRLRIEVADTGIGISDEDLPRIFERFYVVDKSRSRTSGGTGLGLSIMKHIILLHNGDIDIKSRKGQGTTFFIYLPFHLLRKN